MIRRALYLVALLASSSNAFVHTNNALIQKENLRLRQQSAAALVDSTSFPPAAKSSSSVLFVSSSSTPSGDDDGFSWSFNPLYAGFAAFFLGFALVAPGDFSGDAGQQVLEAFLANPTKPEGVNELFMIVFNSLGIMPIIMAKLLAPQGSKRGLPAAPFCLVSEFAGFFGLIPYVVFRDTPVERKTMSEASWFTRNVLENKIFNWVQVLLILSLPFTSGAVEVGDLSVLWDGFYELASTTKIASVSTMDLVILSTVAATLIPKDYELRNPYYQKDDSEEVNKVKALAASTVLFPVLGAALYCATRPPLPEE